VQRSYRSGTPDEPRNRRHVNRGGVAITVPLAVVAAKGRNLKSHRAGMTRNFLGGLIIAGAFTFVPGRLMWMIFLG